MPGYSIGPVFSVTYVNAARDQLDGNRRNPSVNEGQRRRWARPREHGALEGQRAPESIALRDELDLHVDLVLGGCGEIANGERGVRPQLRGGEQRTGAEQGG